MLQTNPRPSMRNFLFVVLLLLTDLASALPPPPPGQLLHDPTGVLEAAERKALAAIQGRMEEQGFPLAVVIVPKLKTVSSSATSGEQLAADLYQAWGLEKRGGLLLLLVTQEPETTFRGDRSEFREIYDLRMKPYFRAGSYGKGVLESREMVEMARLKREFLEKEQKRLRALKTKLESQGEDKPALVSWGEKLGGSWLVPVGGRVVCLALSSFFCLFGLAMLFRQTEDSSFPGAHLLAWSVLGLTAIWVPLLFGLLLLAYVFVIASLGIAGADKLPHDPNDPLTNPTTEL